MAGILLGLDKRPGVCSVRVGDTWRCMISTYVLKIAVTEAKETYRTDQLCGDMEGGTEGGGGGPLDALDVKKSHKIGGLGVPLH